MADPILDVGECLVDGQGRTVLALAPDGERTFGRFSSDPTATTGVPHIDVVLNWFDELNARAPIER